MIASLLLAAALAGQAERAPTVRYVSLPDSYAPDLAPGEVLVPGSVYDVVRVGTSSQPPTPVAPAPQVRTVPAPQAAPPVTYGSCYASSYAPTATYAVPAPQAPQVTYAIPSCCQGGTCGRVIESVPRGEPLYGEPPPTARPGRRRERMAFGLGLTSEWETRRRNEIHLGRYDSRSAVFSPERWTGTRGR